MKNMLSKQIASMVLVFVLALYVSTSRVSAASSLCDSTNLNLSISHLNDSANLCIGSAFANVGGGAAPYTYLWSNGATAQQVDNLCAGPISVQVYDQLGCVRSASVTIDSNGSSVNPCDNSNLNVALNPINANGGCNGQATPSVSGGYIPYTYLWSTGSTVAQANNLCIGTYTLIVTDNAGCTKSQVVSIINDSTVSPCLTTSINININYVNAGDSCTGYATAYVDGGLLPYTYNWNTGATGVQVNSLCAGDYTLVVTDANGCTKSAVVTIVSDPCLSSSLSVSVTPVNAHGGCNGQASAAVTGGQGPYTYNWNTGFTSDNLSGLCASNYTLVVTDAMGCSRSQVILVVDDSIPPPDPCSSSNLNFVLNPVNAVSGCNGSVSSNVTGGQPPYTYDWNTGASTAQISNVCAGTYTLTVTDAMGCTYRHAIFVDTVYNPCQTTTLALNPNYVNANSGCNGSASVDPSGGQAPYTYSWTNSETTSQVSNLCAGNYTVFVTDGLGCSKYSVITINNPGPCDNSGLHLTVNHSDATLGCNGSVSGNTTGGQPPYTYNWNTGATTPFVSNLCAGNYTVVVTDANGCSSSEVVTVAFEDVRCGNNLNKVSMCHNGHTICVASSAVNAHLAHGDQIGHCSFGPGRSMAEVISLSFEIYPNPASDKAILELNSIRCEQIVIGLYDISGKLVKTIFNQLTEEGEKYMITCNLVGIQPGVYFYKLTTNGETMNKKMVVIK